MDGVTNARTSRHAARRLGMDADAAFTEAEHDDASPWMPMLAGAVQQRMKDRARCSATGNRFRKSGVERVVALWPT